MSSLRHMLDDELINTLDDARHQSPIIGELCRRLDALTDRPSVRTATCECPVCKADLKADYDEANDTLELDYASS